MQRICSIQFWDHTLFSAWFNSIISEIKTWWGHNSVRRFAGVFFPVINPVKIDTQEIHNLTGQHPAHPVGWIGKVESHMVFFAQATDRVPKKTGLFFLQPYTLQGINISHLGKRKIIFKMPFLGDMLVPWRVKTGFFFLQLPGSLTVRPWKNDGWKMNFLLGRSLFGGHVKLQGGSLPKSSSHTLDLELWKNPPSKAETQEMFGVSNTDAHTVFGRLGQWKKLCLGD